MTLCDTGPIVALLNSADAQHARCTEALPDLRGPLISTWICVTEMMYLLGKYIGSQAQDELWAWIEDGVLVLHDITFEERSRMRMLMNKYRDVPMDVADASLVASAETLNTTRVFTLDRHFFAYRLRGVQAFEVVP